VLHALDVRVADLVREGERGAGVALGVGEILGPLRLLDREPPVVCPFRAPRPR
jgi:hypothetical protein